MRLLCLLPSMCAILVPLPSIIIRDTPPHGGGSQARGRAVPFGFFPWLKIKPFLCPLRHIRPFTPADTYDNRIRAGSAANVGAAPVCLYLKYQTGGESANLPKFAGRKARCYNISKLQAPAGTTPWPPPVLASSRQHRRGVRAPRTTRLSAARASRPTRNGATEKQTTTETEGPIMQEANDIFFGTLEQYTHDSTAGAAVLAAVAATLDDAPTLKTSASDEAPLNLRWFSTRPESERVQIMALAAAVKRYIAQTEGRRTNEQAPAAYALRCLQLAAAIYRHLKNKKSAVSNVVKATTIQTRAAYLAIVRSNILLINQMRQVKKMRSWSMISDALKVVTGKKIPPSTLLKVHAEVTAEIQARANAPAMVAPTHWEKEEISDETREAYAAAGFEI